MSVATWRAAFYPDTAQAFVERAKRVGLSTDTMQRVAIEHSLSKWTGLLGSSLKAHGVYFDPYSTLLREGTYATNDDDDAGVEIAGESCALCALSAARTGLVGSAICRVCPLALSRDGKPCVDVTDDEELSPWETFQELHDPKPMIRALRKAKKWLEAQATGEI